MAQVKLQLCAPLIGALEKRAVRACLDSGFVSSVGPLIAEFENNFARYVGAKYAVATASGTAALHVAMRVLAIGHDDGVIVPDLTFVASVNPALYCRARPILADVNQTTWTLDSGILEKLCQKLCGSRPRPRAIVPVHLYGCPCDMPAIRAIARKYGLVIIEDATEALGTVIHGKYAGTWGEIGCFSFNGNKMITTGGGGMLVTNSKRLADRARHLVNQARVSPDEYLHDTIGYNYRMTNLTAALGLAQLQRLAAILAKKRRIAEYYRKALAGLPGLQLMPAPAGTQNCFWLYSVLFASAEQRRRAAHFLAARGIPTRRFFVPLHRQPYMQTRLWTMQGGKLKVGASGISDDLYSRGLSLPSSPDMTTAQQTRVVRALREFFAAG